GCLEAHGVLHKLRWKAFPHNERLAHLLPRHQLMSARRLDIHGASGEMLQDRNYPSLLHGRDEYSGIFTDFDHIGRGRSAHVWRRWLDDGRENHVDAGLPQFSPGGKDGGAVLFTAHFRRSVWRWRNRF